MTKTVMDDETHFKTMALLKEHCHMIGDRLVRYDAEWDDQRIATESGALVPAIGRLRTKLYGKLAPKVAVAEATLLDQLVAKHNALAKALLPLDPSFLIGDTE